jgi:hypothetical protein
MRRGLLSRLHQKRLRTAKLSTGVHPVSVQRTTEEQKEFLRGVSAEGYCAVIAQSVDEARETLEWYIGIADHEPPSVPKTNLICQAHNAGRKRERRNKKKK